MKEIERTSLDPTFVSEIRQIIVQGRNAAYNAVNSAMVATYWNLGKRIVEEEQKGNSRAEYGTGLLKMLSKNLTHDFGSGFRERYLAYFRQFYLSVPDLSILQTRLQND